MSFDAPTTSDRVPVVADVWGEGSLTRRQVAGDLIVGLAVAALGVAAQVPYSAWSAVAAALLGLALAVRRCWLPLMVVLAVVASLLQVVSGQIAAGPDVVYAPLFFTLGADRDKRVRQFGLACVLVAVVVAGLWGALVQDRDPGALGALYIGGTFAAMAAVFSGGGWTVGYLRWQRRQAVQLKVSAELSAAEQRRTRERFELEQERSRTAADVHDLAAHSWAVVAALADGARYHLDTDPNQARQALATIGETARSAMSDVRVLLAQLRQTGSGGQVLRFEELDVLVGRLRTSGMDLRLERHGSPPESALLLVSTRRVLAEALTNALRHGDLAQPVEVCEDWRDGYRLRVVNAVGADQVNGVEGVHQVKRSRGHGQLGMAERITGLGGALVSRRAGDEWVVEAVVPS